LIRRLVADGVPQRQVARDLGIGRSTVERAAVPTSFAPFEPLVQRLLKDTPDMPATVIAERVDWTGSISWFRDNVRRLRPEHRPVDPSDRLTWLAGDAAQCDLWFPPKKIPLEDGSKRLLPVMVITAAHSRLMVGQMIPTRHTEDLLLGMWGLLQQLGRVPRRLIWDNESGIGRGKRHAAGVGAFTGTLATTLQRLKPYDPESKGLGSDATGSSRPPSCPGVTSSPRPTSTPSSLIGWPSRTRADRAHHQDPPDRPPRHRQGSDAVPATSRSGTRVGQPGPAGTRLLRPPRQQRLLRRPGGDRPVRRRDSRSVQGRSSPRGTARCQA